MTQNAHLKFENVFIPTKNKLTKAIDFEKSAGKVLLATRIGVAWFVSALAAGAYETCLKYALERKQFGRPIASFQLIQERLSRMLANVESSTLLCVHLLKLLDQGQLTMGQASRAKAHCSKAARETIALARECMGGNGILLENRVIKSMMDMEALYTYEGTYDINSLISGRELTGGIPAFK